jgi:hypothetical protein
MLAGYRGGRPGATGERLGRVKIVYYVYLWEHVLYNE